LEDISRQIDARAARTSNYGLPNVVRTRTGRGDLIRDRAPRMSRVPCDFGGGPLIIRLTTGSAPPGCSRTSRGAESERAARYRGFESLRIRHCDQHEHRARSGSLCSAFVLVVAFSGQVKAGTSTGPRRGDLGCGRRSRSRATEGPAAVDGRLAAPFSTGDQCRVRVHPETDEATTNLAWISTYGIGSEQSSPNSPRPSDRGSTAENLVCLPPTQETGIRDGASLGP
jgi:hypothetical protein